LQEQRPGLIHALGVLKHREFSLFFGALLVAAIGGQIQTFTNVLQIYDLTQSPFQIGLTGLARAIPLIGLSLVGGVIADRVDRRHLIMVAQLTAAMLALVLAALTASGNLQVWHIYAVTVVQSSVMALSAPARGALIPSLVPRDHLLHAFAINSTTWQLANIIGPSIAGVAVAMSGFAATYVVNSAANLIAFLCVLVIHTRPVEARRRQTALQAVREGLAFVRFRSIILALLAMDSAAMLFGTYRVVLPSIGDHLGLDAARVGLLWAAPGVGSLLGAAFIMSLTNIRYKGLFIVGAILAYCVGLVALALSPGVLTVLGSGSLAASGPAMASTVAFLVALLASGGLGLFDSLQATPRNALIQLMTPDELRGRVESLRQMLTAGMPALGQMYMGATASLLGAPLALMVGAATCAAVVLGITAGRRDVRAASLDEEPIPMPSMTPQPIPEPQPAAR
jgi:MFS family permease